jgi:hypothetical protein
MDPLLHGIDQGEHRWRHVDARVEVANLAESGPGSCGPRVAADVAGASLWPVGAIKRPPLNRQGQHARGGKLFRRRAGLLRDPNWDQRVGAYYQVLTVLLADPWVL